VSFDGTGNITVADSTKLALTGGSLTGGLGIATTDQHLVATESGTSVQWRGRILSKNAAADRAVLMGTLGTRSLIAAHNNALSDWVPLFINFDGGTGSGAVYFGQAGTVHNGTAQFVGDSRALFGPNVTYGGKLYVGGSGPASAEGVSGGLYVSDGNLHIDAGVSHGIYLGYTRGQGVLFGNGATGVSAQMDTTGQLWRGLSGSGDRYATLGQLNAWVGGQQFYSNRGANVSLLTQDSAALQAFSSDGGPAFMSFHRGGAYAINMGLDYDNIFKIGGWSAGTAPRWSLDMSGNMSIPGTFSANAVVANRLAAGYDSGVSGAISCSNWFRTSDATGLYFASYGTGVAPIQQYASNGASYGSVAAYGATSGWSGFSINGGVVFMHDNNSNGTWGFFDDCVSKNPPNSEPDGQPRNPGDRPRIQGGCPRQGTTVPPRHGRHVEEFPRRRESHAQPDQVHAHGCPRGVRSCTGRPSQGSQGHVWNRLMYDRKRLKAQLTIDEDKRNRLYVDTVGKVSIGVGRNLTDKGISDNACDFLLEEDIDETEAAADRLFPWWRGMSDARQEAFLNWLFNVGPGTAQTFVNTLRALKEQRWEDAALGYENSKWFKQVGARAERIVAKIRKG
jgi:GH24 family phage-related lysozyme (muramidase)